jgi:hypothetical protein
MLDIYGNLDLFNVFSYKTDAWCVKIIKQTCPFTDLNEKSRSILYS